MKFIYGDITKETSGLLVHGCNTRGVMGGGVALAIRNKWPIVYQTYRSRGKGKHLLGSLDIIKITDELYVGNGYSQEFLGTTNIKYADITAVNLVLQKAFSWCYINNVQLKTVKIGCLRGGLDWTTEVKPLFEKYEAHFKSEAQIFDI
jgi:O-acetyl-ADP-ribose deacetylase (regulator of RNase III)